MVILREIQALGYEGSRTILREYIQPKRALRPGRATVRFETEPDRRREFLAKALDQGPEPQPSKKTVDSTLYSIKSLFFRSLL